jgi:proteic killer suppression protein
MIQSFRDQGSADLFEGVDSKAARKCLPSTLHQVAKRRLDNLDAARSLKDLAAIPGNELHPLKRERAGQYAIRINDAYRICFAWTELGPVEVEVTDYH